MERFFGWLKEHRRIATRFEKLADAYLTMVRLACIKRLLSHLFSDTPYYNHERRHSSFAYRTPQAFYLQQLKNTALTSLA